MKNKLGLISGLIFSLVIAGSAFANSGNAATRSAESSILVAKAVKSKELTQKNIISTKEQKDIIKGTVKDTAKSL